MAKKKQWQIQGQVVKDDVGSLSLPFALEQIFLGLLSGLLGCFHCILFQPGSIGSISFLFNFVLKSIITFSSIIDSRSFKKKKNTCLLPVRCAIVWLL